MGFFKWVCGGEGSCIEKCSEGVQGRLKVWISREQLISRVENFLDDFNDKETTGGDKYDL